MTNDATALVLAAAACMAVGWTGGRGWGEDAFIFGCLTALLAGSVPLAILGAVLTAGGAIFLAAWIFLPWVAAILTIGSVLAAVCGASAFLGARWHGWRWPRAVA